MKSNSAYIKSPDQITLEQILHQLKDSELHISHLQKDPAYTVLYQDFSEALAAVINNIVHEQSTHNLINSVALSCSSQYYNDLKEYDTLFEVISETLIGLYKPITKAYKVKDPNADKIHIIDNTGRIRIDTFQDKEPELFVFTLRKYIQNNIILGLARHCKITSRHVEPDMTNAPIEEDTFHKIESIKYNKINIENSFDLENTIASKLSYTPDLCSKLITSVIERFGKRKPVAAYIYLLIMLEQYDVKKVIGCLKTTTDFNTLFHNLFRQLEEAYPVDLHTYDNVIFNADKYLDSFKSISGTSKKIVQNTRRGRIDRLATETRKTVYNLSSFKDARKDYVCFSKDSRVFCL